MSESILERIEKAKLAEAKRAEEVANRLMSELTNATEKTKQNLKSIEARLDKQMVTLSNKEEQLELTKRNIAELEKKRKRLIEDLEELGETNGI